MLSYAIFPYTIKRSCFVPCPLEDHDVCLVSNLDDGHISLIGRVLEIKAEELVLIISVMQFLQTGKKPRDDPGIVGVGDVESVAAWCRQVDILFTDFLGHGGGLGKERRARMERIGRAHV